MPARYVVDRGRIARGRHEEGDEYLVPDARPGFLRLDPAAYAHVYMQDVDPAEARALAETQRPIAGDALSAPVEVAAWRALPAWYLVSEDDRMINPDAERALAARMGAVTTALPGASHASPVSRRAEVARAIMAAAGR